ncbi:Txe/YoeB family addiction module toxin [Cyanobacterium aponinum AL20118]|uniref:Endoribonuclease YoeB n=1 Tax=Cyanobacterium aponinum AL20115 TaxID=3090662 RepID=A0AAF1C6Q8_9CHRO|nr:Txe/YoeB family addiction module toxin [Cyanobacterium aponinum]PHV62769.1 Txe/YoeB family addiction module toxin [Cyanobacterium aponinum IPPAS B-1201]WPF90039.1 Txe/YoeB family addiction module toxin [Cyanobacterium aponinum AL20115]
MSNKAVIFDSQFRDDLRWWFRKDKKVSERILNLIEATILNPTEGIGKPEHLKYLPGSTWSRRITQEHRLVYQISSDKIIFLQCRYHYS